MKTVQIAISQELRDLLKDEKGDNTYDVFIRGLYRTRDLRMGSPAFTELDEERSVRAVAEALTDHDLLDQVHRMGSPAFTERIARSVLGLAVDDGIEVVPWEEP